MRPADNRIERKLRKDHRERPVLDIADVLAEYGIVKHPRSWLDSRPAVGYSVGALVGRPVTFSRQRSL